MDKLYLDNAEFMPHLIRLVNEGHLVTIIARGNSMRPFIEDCRDKLVFGKYVDAKVGDVILAEIQPGHYVCHRIEKLEGETVVMRGDGNVPNPAVKNSGIEVFTRDKIRAKLVRIVRKGKTYDIATSRIWKVYSAIWTHLLPLRRYLLAFYRLAWLHQIPARFKR